LKGLHSRGPLYRLACSWPLKRTLFVLFQVTNAMPTFKVMVHDHVISVQWVSLHLKGLSFDKHIEELSHFY
jgi:hypothetical protein